MADPETQRRVRRMAEKVIDRSLRSKVENTIGLLCILCGTGLMVFAFEENAPGGLEGSSVRMLLLALNAAPFFLVRLLQRKRKAALLNIVMPYGRHNSRTLNEEACILLTAEHRTIEEADFRRNLAKALKRIR